MLGAHIVVDSNIAPFEYCPKTLYSVSVECSPAIVTLAVVYYYMLVFAVQVLVGLVIVGN